MARRVNLIKLAGVYSAIANHPGKKMVRIADILNMRRYAVARLLPALDEKYLFLYEDNERLYIMPQR